MKERPILFSGSMVRAILDGRKTQTRRIVKVPWKGSTKTTPYEPYYVDEDGVLMVGIDGPYRPFVDVVASPYGVPGDRLWVRETHRFIGWNEDGRVTIEYIADGKTRTVRDLVDDFDMWVDRQSTRMIRAGARMMQHDLDGNAVPADGDRDECWIEMPEGVEVPATPSIHMPRWASRLTLEVTGVRVERLQDITGEDILAEGVGHDLRDDERGAFEALALRDRWRSLWTTINGADSWGANPWVWVVEFRRV